MLSHQYTLDKLVRGRQMVFLPKEVNPFTLISSCVILLFLYEINLPKDFNLIIFYKYFSYPNNYQHKMKLFLRTNPYGYA